MTEANCHDTLKITFVGNRKHTVLPAYKTSGAAAFDFVAADEPFQNEHGVWMVPTGISAEIPHGHVMLLFIRSGLGYKDITLSNSVGVIDSDYRGEIMGMLSLKNDKSLEKLPKAGERFMQGMIVKAPQMDIKLVDSLSDTERGDGGFGSTGTK